MLRVDRETTEPIDHSIEERFIERIVALPEDVVVVSDYAKGMVTPDFVKSITDSGKRVIIDPKSSDFTAYTGAYLVTPNYTELCSAAGQEKISHDAVEDAGRRLMEKFGISNLLVTLGPEGMILIENDGSATHIHTRAREVYDVTGAGDTVIAAVSSAVAAGAALEDACNIANIAAGIVVGKRRTATASPQDILNYAFGPSASGKIIDRKTLMERVVELKKEGRKIVFTNGCFDILHMGHIAYLNDARDLVDVLIVVSTQTALYAD